MQLEQPKTESKIKSLAKGFGYAGVAVLLFAAGTALAQGSAPAGSVATIAERVTDTFSDLAKLITGASYIAGMGFAIGAIMKFKQYKDNPQQIQIGTPIAMMFIAAALIFLPEIFRTAGITVFGEAAKAGGVEGVTTFDRSE